MNPLFLLLGLLGAGALGGLSSGGSSGTRDSMVAGPSDGDPSSQDNDTTDNTDTGAGTGNGSKSGGSTTDGGTNTDSGASSGGSGTGTGTDSGTSGGSTSDSGTSGGSSSGSDTSGGTTGSGTGTGSSGSGTDTSGGGMDMGGGGHSMPAITPPAAGASQAEIDAYVAAVKAQAEVHVHDMTSDKAPEHDAAMNLVPRADATHVAISDGDWFDPATWHNGQIPGDDAKVLIPDGISVTYDQVSSARLFTVRVDGTLDFDPQADSQMIFDTFVVSPTGHLVIGTDTNPVDPNVDIDLIVANNGPIDTNWDPMLLSRGLISHGDVDIHGAIKDSHDKVTTDPMAGDTSVKFSSIPTGWQVGDTIVVAGTTYEGHSWDNSAGAVVPHPSQDETRVITQIDSDGTVHFSEALVYDHDTPRSDLFTSVANYTRNVSIETENADSAQIYERGHVMFMHSDNVDVRYAEFHELGRTDKSVESFSADSFSSTSFDSNVQGRYALHLHRTGTDDPTNPTTLEGNAVYGSPGWGIVQHDSNAVVTNNATFDTFGAGFVAETGNEIGSWSDNIAIYAEGVSWDSPKDSSIIGNNFDTARGGHGFWFQGRMVDSTDNIAASVNTGFVYFHRGDGAINFDSSNFDYPEALLYSSDVSANLTPILTFDGNEVFAAKEGLHVVKHGPNQGHDVGSNLTDFTAWNVTSGAHLEYTSHYTLTNFDVVGIAPTGSLTATSGISIGGNASDITIVDPTIDGFAAGIDFYKFFSSDFVPASAHQFTVVNPTITGAQTDYLNYDPQLDTILSNSDLPLSAPDLQLNPLIFDGTLTISGTKIDSLGQTDFPGGTDSYSNFDSVSFQFDASQIQDLVAQKGYYTTSSGQDYTLLDVYFTDRLTGNVYYETHPVYLNTGAGGSSNGVQDITSSGGTLYAGNTPLDTAILAVPGTATQSATMSSMTMSSMPQTQSAMVPDTWLSDQSTDTTSGSTDTTTVTEFAATTTTTTPDTQPTDTTPIDSDLTTETVWRILTVDQGTLSETTPATTTTDESDVDEDALFAA